MRSNRVKAYILSSCLVLAACGGEPGGEQEGTTTTTADPGVTTTAAATDTTEPPGGDQPDPSGLPDMSGGSATLTIAGEAEVFDWFVCFFGEATALLEERDDVTFVAVGRRGGSFPSQEGVEAQIIVSQTDEESFFSGGILYTGFASDGSSLAWEMFGNDAATIDGDRVTAEGEFERIVDDQPGDGSDTALGTLEATCSPNSVGP